MGYEVQNFQEDVIAASSETPVLVDFWAEWCGPCRVLGPVLEKLADEQQGQWQLVKVDTDKNPEISMQYRIQGIPAVKLFVDGEVVDEFTGALPEHAVRQWLEKAVPSESGQLLSEAERLVEAGQPEQAAEILERALEEDPDHPIASGMLASILVFKDPDRAAGLARIAAGDPRFASISEAIGQVAAARSIQDQADEFSGQTGGKDYVEASRRLSDGDLDGAVRSLIEVLKANRYLDDDGARKTGVALFTLLGPSHPVTRAHRRTFDMWLY